MPSHPISRPIEEVFAVLTDPTRSPEWSKHSIRGELLTEGLPRVGGRRRSVVKRFGGIGTMESVFEMTEIDPARAVALRQVSASWGGSGSTRYTFTPVDGGTRVDWTWELNPTGLGAVRSASCRLTPNSPRDACRSVRGWPR